MTEADSKSFIARLLGKLMPGKPQATSGLSAEQHDELRGYIERDIAAGFRTVPEIVESVADMLDGDPDPAMVSDEARRLAARLLHAHLAAQATWPAVTDCDRLDNAFADLESQGIVARQDFTCCGTCGVAEIGAEIGEAENAGIPVQGYAFYHQQDTESAVEGYGLCLNFGAMEDGEAHALEVGRRIVDTLARHGLETNWDGTWGKRIAVSLDWKRRRVAEHV